MKLSERIAGLFKSLFMMFFILPITLLQLVLMSALLIGEYTSQPFNIFRVIFNVKYRGIYGDNFILVMLYIAMVFYYMYILISMYIQTKKAMKRLSTFEKEDTDKKVQEMSGKTK